MRVIGAPSTLSELTLKIRNNGASIGLVPTMGALHQGHTSLIKTSKKLNEVTVVSIFVNPIQFNQPEDLKSYPRTLEEDLAVLRKMGVDYVFVPSEEEMYPQRPHLSMDFGSLGQRLEGAHRPGHFNGVALVVSKLFNIIHPTRAYFGLKDLQQFMLIRKLVEELNFQIEIVGLPTVREPSGLAMSSRNQKLSNHGKEIAAMIYKGLEKIEAGIRAKRGLKDLMRQAKDFYGQVQGLEVEYVEGVNTADFSSLAHYDSVNELAVCFAGYVEGIRLIDNLYLRLK